MNFKIGAQAILRRALTFDGPRYLGSQVALVRHNLTLAGAAAAVVGIVMAAMHHHVTGDVRIWVWCAVEVAVSLAGAVLGRWQPSPGHAHQIRRQAQVLWLFALAQGLTWGTLAALFMRTDLPQTTNFVLGATAGLNSGGMVLFAPMWPLSVIYLLTTVPPAVWVLMQSPHLPDQALGLACAIYVVAMLVFAWHAARAVRESIDVRFENADLIGRLRDQTQRAFSARQEAEEALLEAEAADRAKGVFMAAASHDLRQPLHALGLFASALGRTHLSPSQRALLDHVEHSADAACDMLSTLLDFSKVDAGVITSRPQALALQPVLSELQREFSAQAQSQRLQLRLHATPLVVMADGALVERIVRNLVSNALRYTERGGVLIGVRRRGDAAVIEVWDTGIGIPPDQHRAIFREFHQLGNPERDRRKGLGLGLAIVEGLARAMNVPITLASRPGRGSVFRLALPLSREAVREVARPTDAQPDLQGAKVLVIDDDESVRAAMAELLTSWGAWCEVVESADQALGLTVRFVPDLIVADYRLRGHRNGREAIDLVRQALGLTVPGVLVTGDTAADRLREAQASELTLLHKPVPADELHATLMQLLGRQPGVMDGAARRSLPAENAPAAG